MDPVAHLLVVAVCLVLSAFFSGSETALLRLRAHEIEREAAAPRGPSAIAIRSLLESTSRLLVTILFGNNVVNILGAAVASTLAVFYLGEELGIVTATVVMTLIVLTFCEILPKAFAARHPVRISHLVALPLYLLHQALRPAHALLDRAMEPLLRSVPGEREGAATAEEVLRLARRARQAVVPGRVDELSIIASAAGAAEMTVEEIMVPRTEIVAFSVQTPPAELLEQVIEDRYTRVPIYEGSIDTIRGIVHLKDLIKLVRGGGQELQGILKPVLRVPERKPILRLLADMQRAFVHVAIVKDEFGVTEGLVTQEDILEEIVGEIRDEFDREELLTIRRLPDESYEALGRVKVLDFNRETGWQVDAEPGDTLSGLTFNALGHTPSPGDRVQVGDYAITVGDTSGTRITRVRVARQPLQKAGDGAQP